jgi:hypothetical protein
VSKRIYAGIGSRRTPANILKSMEYIGEQLAPNWHLRSGFADGADCAFGRGAEKAGGEFTMFLPWEDYNGAPIGISGFITPRPTLGLVSVAADTYNADPLVISNRKPNWDKLSDATRLLMVRNVAIVLGEDLQSPAECVVCWTPFAKAEGGTGMAIRVAKANNIPVFDLYDVAQQKAFCEFTKN